MTKATATKPNHVLAIVCAGICLAQLDLFIVNVALPDIARDFKSVGLDDLSWVLNGYAIVYAALLVFLGRLAERQQAHDNAKGGAQTGFFQGGEELAHGESAG